jgi:hypothetical protein
MPSAQSGQQSAEEARANDIAQKSESMARELSQKREMRIRQERVRHLSSDDPPARSGRTPPPRQGRDSSPPKPGPDDMTLRAEDNRARQLTRDTRVLEPPTPVSPPFYPERRPSMLDEVAVELEELLRDLRAGWRRWAASDRITFVAALATLVGVLLPWTSDKGHVFQLGIVAGGAFHAALAVAAIALVVARGRRFDERGERLSGRERATRGRRASLWYLLLGATSTVLCAYFLVIYGLQRSAQTGLEIRFGLYVTLAAGMGLSYGGFARFFGRQHD